MDQLDAITLLYLSKHWDGNGSLLDCAHTFQQTKSELQKTIVESNPLPNRIADKGFHL